MPGTSGTRANSSPATQYSSYIRGHTLIYFDIQEGMRNETVEWMASFLLVLCHFVIYFFLRSLSACFLCKTEITPAKLETFFLVTLELDPWGSLCGLKLSWIECNLKVESGWGSSMTKYYNPMNYLTKKIKQRLKCNCSNERKFNLGNYWILMYFLTFLACF